MPERTYELNDVIVRGRFLNFKRSADACPIKSPLAIPFGSVSDPRSHVFKVRVSDGQLNQLVAIPDKMKEGSAEVQILPAFKRTDAISVRGHGRIMFEVWEVNGDVDRIKAIQLISRSHYLSAPVSGLILGCRFVNADEQQQVLSQAKVSERPDPWSEAWYEKSGGMVACAMIGTLYHGNPRGRKHIAEEEKIANLTKGQWHKKNRKEIISQLGVLWASRFAVDAPYRGLGLGSLLAARLVNVCLKHHVPQARYIEVVTTLPTDKAKALLKEESKERDFLVSAGYTRVPELLPSRRQLRADPETGERVEFVSAKKLYYYKKVE